MSEPTKCCGNCRWWKHRKYEGSGGCGDCKYPLPYIAGWLVSGTRCDCGTDCPCFAPPIPQEVLAAVKEYKDWREQYPAECGYLRTDKLPGVIADYAVTLPQLKGN